MANGTPTVPQPVLPRINVLTASPTAFLSEIRSSFNGTLASIEASMPMLGPGFPGAPPAAGQAAASPLDFLSSIEATLPAGLPRFGTPQAAPQAAPGAPRAPVTRAAPRAIKELGGYS